MAIRVALNHVTTYQYDRNVILFPQVVRLRPAAHSRTPIISYAQRVTPEKHFCNWQQDPYGNYLARLVFDEPLRTITVEVDIVAEMSVINPFDFFIEDDAEHYPFEYAPALRKELAPYFETIPLTPRLAMLVDLMKARYALDLTTNKRRVLNVVIDVNQHLQRTLEYIIRMEPGVQTPEETLTACRGSCRDFAWLGVQVFRQLGIATRFVSGYSIQLRPDVKSLDGPSGVEQDVCDLHAWYEVYLPGAGWVGFDATSGLACTEGHIPLACTADHSSAAPITGSFTWPGYKEGEVADVEFKVKMSVTRIHEDPRVTKPYTDEQWDRIDRLGHRIDEELRVNDVRLSMGGEPTFVSIDDMDGAEWNTVAMGPNKRGLGMTLIKRLRDRFSPQALLHFGQGKWYPGESLPRWAFSCYWRKDGVPIWENPDLVGDEHKPESYGPDDAQRFIHLLADKLNVTGKHILPGYEDTWYYLWKERRLPVNVDPFDSKLKNEEDRVRLAKVFEQGLDKRIGYCLPLARRYGASGPYWASGPWFFRPERMYLIPGDSPMGFRLPLDSLPWVTEGDFPYSHEQDPMDSRPPLPAKRPVSRQRFYRADGPLLPGDFFSHHEHGPAGADGTNGEALRRSREAQRHDRDSQDRPDLARGDSADWIVRTALCVEPRNGHLYLFMPPVRYLEEYLEIVEAVERTAAELNNPVLIEGYHPPYDYRLQHIKVTPDPGVIEVNIHPAMNWSELSFNTGVLYEEARLTRLGTEKFMLDGRHSGTGGGNHIVVGGPTPADSPFLRRPDLLRSLVSYWNNHPALSYLFSGLFIGPTSQAPRVDEARHDALHELEVAFQQIPEHSHIPPWLVDRIFRNLLTDTTGNTHRAEFCIDKLYSPEHAAGRLGLLEMRAFEMPPHARMSLTQQLLLRALIAKFWREPYRARLVKWGTELHDRFMLPHFVEQDFTDVISDLRTSGYPFDPSWFDPHVEFRFPKFGEVVYRGVHMEVRQAIEPWHVLGEEPGAGGTVRYVDSSVERVQLKVRGMTDPRHVVCCNGRAVPLHPTGTRGEFVAGIRYRAWQPPSCLHPTIGVHSPLVFDLFDSWSGRSVGGCSYHVTHPGGLSYTRFPVNANEAESRRTNRFFQFGHTPGPMRIEPATRNPDFPYTLDLRRAQELASATDPMWAVAITPPPAPPERTLEVRRELART